MVVWLVSSETEWMRKVETYDCSDWGNSWSPSTQDAPNTILEYSTAKWHFFPTETTSKMFYHYSDNNLRSKRYEKIQDPYCVIQFKRKSLTSI